MKLTLIAAAVLVISVTGCSSCRNLIPSEAHDWPPMENYGGVKSACAGFYESPKDAGLGMKAVWPMVVVDVVCSAIGDTLALPITICSTYYKRNNAEQYLEPVEPAPPAILWAPLPPPPDAK